MGKVLNLLKRRLNFGFKKFKIYKGVFGFFFSDKVNFYITGEYELEKTNYLKKISKPGSVFYDIGSFKGYYSVVANSLGLKVYAFEPNPNTFKILKINFLTNNINGMLFNKGVSNKTSSLKFVCEKFADSSHILREGEKNDHFRSIECIKLDDFIIENKLDPPNIIKMDVEGHENYALEGMKEIILKYKPIILLDIHENDGYDEERLKNYLKEINYSMKIISNDKKPDFILEFNKL